jgi:TonB-linked SusC/RagA family outer membrane protein
MRVSIINMVLLIGGLKLFAATPSNGQDLTKVTVKLELNNETLKGAFAQLERQTEYTFIFQEFKGAKLVTIEKGSYTLKDALESILEKTGLNLEYTNPRKNYIVIHEVEGSRKRNESFNDLPLSTPSSPSFSVTGKVTEAVTQESLAGVNILVKGTTRGTTTDADGKYSLDVETSDILIFSFIGYKTLETTIAGKTSIDITLENDATTMQEVVVKAGYWDVNEKENTGSIVRVTSDQISKQPVTNPLQALQGRLTGVYVTQTSGLPGAGFTIQIRGKNSLRSDGNEPLYIIDGVPYTNTSINSGAGQIVLGTSPFNNIDPASIESIDVLKDADATAIYGSQGANGVVLITTKKGKAGKTSITGGFYSGISQVPHRIDLLNTEQYLEMRREGFANDGITKYPVGTYDIDGTWDQTRYTDWQKVLIGGTAHMSNADGSISGGSANTRFLLSGSYNKQTTVYPGDFAYQRGAAHFNFSHDSENKKLQLVLTTNFSTDNNNLPANDLIIQSIRLAPSSPRLFTDDGALNWENSTWENPLAKLVNKYKASTKGLFTNATISYEIFKGLTVKTNMGYNTLQMQEVSTFPLKAYSPARIAAGLANGQAYFGRSSADTWVVEPQVEFIKKVGIGDLTAFAATTFRQSSQDRQSIYAGGYTVDALIEDITSAPFIIPSASSSQYRYCAVYGRINYNIRQKYIINLTARRDGSSRFGPRRRFGNFGAVGVAWIFSNENLFSQNTILNNLLSFGKLRASFGTSGNDQISDYQYSETYTSIKSYTGTGTSIVPSRIANPYYAWEVNQKLEAAIELGFINDRIKLNMNWYRNQSSNQLVGQSIPTTTGFSSFQANFPATVRNQGWEFELSAINITRHSFKWTSSINLTIPQNKLVAYPDIQNSAYANVYEVGKSTFATKKNHYLGVNPSTGIHTFEDNDRDGNPFGAADKYVLVKVGQDYYGGLRNTITAGSFDISFFFQFTKQTGLNYISSFGPAGVSINNQPVFVMSRWSESSVNQGKPITSIQKFTSSNTSDAGSAYNSSISTGTDFAVSDASFVRLQNISLEWHIPQAILKKAAVTGASLYVQGQNLFTLTNYYGFDPQTTSFVSLPTLRVITVGGRITL